jgi:HKD family nuclease
VHRWIEACLDSELPPATELEKALQNGVIVAKLSMFFAPDVIKEKKIYDIDQEVYNKKGLVFRHTDNISQWTKAMRHVKFPEVWC